MTGEWVTAGDGFYRVRALLLRGLDDAVRGSDRLVVVTDRSCYRELDLLKLKVEMSTPAIADVRDLLAADDCRAAGFVYRGIGKGPTGQSDWERTPESHHQMFMARELLRRPDEALGRVLLDKGL